MMCLTIRTEETMYINAMERSLLQYNYFIIYFYDEAIFNYRSHNIKKT